MENEKRGKIVVKRMALIFAVLFATLAFVSIGCASAATIYVPDNFTTIQQAVDNATANDIIIVRDGTYTENVDVNVDHLTIKSENGAASTSVQAANTSDHVFAVTADYVNISGFTVKDATGSDKAGIYLGCDVDRCNISDNNVSNNNIGIWLYYSSSNTLTGNTASRNYLGIYLQKSCDNTFSDNRMFDNNRNFDVYSGYALSYFIQNIDTSNTVDEKPVYYWIGRQNQEVPDNAGFVGVVNSTNITVRDLTLTNNGQGVLFAYTKDSRIENVTTSGNRYGILLSSSSNNILTNNTAHSNICGIYLYSSSSSNNTLTDNNVSKNRYGIWMQYSSYNTLVNNTANSNAKGIWLYATSDNTLTSNIANSNGEGIYLYASSDNTLTNNTVSNNNYGIYLYSSSNTIYNNYFNNTNNAYDNGNNTWNITKTLGTNIIDGPYLGGNYWSDYTGDDLDGDGLGDTMIPYNSSGNIANGGDYIPLMMPAPTPTPTPTPSPTPTPEATTVSISPSTKTVSPGPFTVNVTIEPEVPIAGVQFDLSFDHSLVSANNVTEGNLLKQGAANTYFCSGAIDNAAGTITHVASAITTPGETVSTPGVFATIQMTAKTAAGTSTLDLSNVIVGDINGNPVASEVNDGSVTISTASWDVNGDGFVNVLDMILVGQRFGETGAPGWIPEDVNRDGVINVQDMLP